MGRPFPWTRTGLTPTVRSMRARRLASISICIVSLCAGCSKSSASAGAAPEAGVTTSAGTSAGSGAKPAPPPDGATSCTVTLTGKTVGTGADTALEFRMKNTGSRALRFCQVNVFGYDKAGNVGGSGALSENHELKPGEEFTSTTGVTVNDDKNANVSTSTTLSFVPAVSRVLFTDGSEWEDAKFDYTKGPGPSGAAAAAGASASASSSAPAFPAAAPPAATAPERRPGRPRPPPPRVSH